MIRPNSKERALRLFVLAAGDFFIAWGALAVIVGVRRNVPLAFTEGLLPAGNFHVDAETVVLFGAALVAALGLSGFYENRVTPRTRPSFVTALVIQIALAAIGATALATPLPRTVLFVVPMLEFAALPLWRWVLAAVAPIRPRDTMLVGDDREVGEALRMLRAVHDRRIRVTGSALPRVEELAGAEVRTALRSVEQVLLVSPDADPRVRLELLRIRGPRGYMMLASHVDALLASGTHGWIGDQPLVEVAASCGHGWSGAVKRAIDIAIASVILVCTAPLWLAVWIAVKMDDGGRVLLRQSRVGLGGAPYGMWKFRSMRDATAAETDHSKFPEERITRAGALLRRYHLDELPQLLNVLAGDMSLVGPRPERPELAERILRDVPDFDLRSLVRPGIAGLAQVSAEYDSRPEIKLRYDLMYMCDWSVWLDFRLMLRAVSSSLAGTGR